MGEIRPVHEDFPPAVTEALAKAFDDLVWISTLEEMLSDFEQEIEVGSDFYARLSARLNDGKFQHESELTSFRSAYQAELRGAIDAYSKEISEALPHIYQRSGGGQAPTDQQKADSGRMLGNLIYEALTGHKALSDLPTINVQAGIHGAIRWDRQRKYNPNDWFDILHAAAGMPYCDVFLTERSLASLLRAPHLAYDKRYQTEVFHTAAEAVTGIKERTV
jgi:hypothetical protein